MPSPCCSPLSGPDRHLALAGCLLVQLLLGWCSATGSLPLSWEGFCRVRVFIRSFFALGLHVCVGTMTKVFDGKGSQPDLFAAATRFVLDENEGLLLAMFGGRTARMLFFTGTDEQVRATLDGFKVLSWSELSYYVPGEEDDSKTRLANIEQLVELGRSLLVTCSLSIESGIAGTEERLAARAASGLEASNWYFQELGPTVLAAMHNKRHHGAHTYVGSGKWWRLHLEHLVVPVFLSWQFVVFVFYRCS